VRLVALLPEDILSGFQPRTHRQHTINEVFFNAVTSRVMMMLMMMLMTNDKAWLI
jgi:hypothetical protein